MTGLRFLIADDMLKVSSAGAPGALRNALLRGGTGAALILAALKMSQPSPENAAPLNLGPLLNATIDGNPV